MPGAFLKDKKVLVAGAAGFVGANLVKTLCAHGARITGILHKKPPVVKDDRITYICCDLTQKQDCRRAVAGMDYCFMCAANTSGAAVIENNPLAHVTPNILMNALMLEAAYDAKVSKFIWLSSNSVYPVTAHPVKEGEMMQGELFEKYFCVGWMKRFTEILCEMYATKIKNPMKAVVVRPANIYGPYDDFEWETSHVIPALIRKAVERHDPLEVWGDGHDIKDLIFIDDFIEGLLLAAEKIDTYDPVNIGTGRPISVREALQAILEADGYASARIVFNTLKPSMIPVRMLDVSKAKDTLGFEARTSFADGVKRTIQWYKEALK